MLFKDFAGYLEKLEKISSRLEITKVLAELIEKMSVEETDKGIYLTLGQLGPDFDNKEFNMAIKMVLRSVVEGTGVSANEIERKYKDLGDVGLMVEVLDFKRIMAVKYSVNEIFEKLKIIADEGGGGSQERKVARLSELLLTASSLERKYVARMVIGKLRLGFSEKTVFDALSQMTSGGKTLRKELDKAFQIYPDPGYITKVVKEKGMSGLKNLKVKSQLDKPYFERRKLLAEIIKRNGTLVTDEYYKTNDPAEVQKMHDIFLREGFEGAVIKMWKGEYLPGRQGWNWVKIKEAEGTSGKLSDTLDLVILGYYLGRGKRAGFGIGAFLVGLRKGNAWVSIAKVGTGLTDEEFRELKKKLDKLEIKEKPSNYLVTGALVPDVWVEPSVVVEVAADEITKSPNHAGGVALRFPRLVKFREDKGPKQATTWKEVEEIAKLSMS